MSGAVAVADATARRQLAGMLRATSPAGVGAFLAYVAHPHLRRRARARFAAQGDDAVGGKWAPLADSTKQIKASMGYGGRKTNVRTGHLRDSLVNARPLVFPAGPAGMGLDYPDRWDRPDLFWRGMQAAGRIRGGPARRVVGLSYTSDVAVLLGALSAWVVTGGRRRR